MGQDNPLKPGDANYDPAYRPASPLTRRQALALTEKIRQAAETTWTLLTEAHEKKAWARLGYASWEQYVRTEFGMSRSRSYQLLDQQAVIHELEAAAGVDVHNVDTKPITTTVTEATVRDLKPVLPEVVEKVKQAVKGRPKKTRPAIVAEVVTEERAKVKARQSGGPEADHTAVEVAMQALIDTCRAADPNAFSRTGWSDVLSVTRDRLARVVGQKMKETTKEAR